MAHSDTIETAPPNASMSQLASGIIDDAQALIKQQFAMLRVEMRQDFQRLATGSKFLGAGSVLGGIGLALVAVAVVHAVHYLDPELPMWACWAIVGGVLLAIAVLVGVAGIQLLKSSPPYPDRTLSALSENLSWIKNPPNESNRK